MSFKHHIVTETIDNAQSYMKHCNNEQQFKLRWLMSHERDYKHCFQIETEETVAGFPDVLAVEEDGIAVFLEFKMCDKYGRFKFQPTQPAFYRKHHDLPIYIVVLYKGGNGDLPILVKFFAQRLFDNKLLNVNGSVYIDEVVSALHDEWERDE